MFRVKKIYGVIPRENLVADLERIAKKLKVFSVTKKDYHKHGRYAVRQYYREFGGWNNALRETGLSTWNNAICVDKDKRDIGDKLRFAIFKQDNYKCVICGSSPAIDPSVVLHVDHILAFSKGGKTEASNLRTLCSRCNLGKGSE